MKDYVCLLCNKDLKKKSHYIQHIQKKKSCIMTGEKKNVNKNSKVEKDTSLNDNNEKKVFICNYCNNVFTRKDSLNRHKNGRCKNNLINSISEIEQIKLFCKKLLIELEECKSDIYTLKNIQDDIHNNQTKNIIKNSGNINIMNSNNNTINSNNNITIVQFGKEDISKMNISKLMDIFLKSTGGNIIANMLKQINFNPEYPEFNSIYMSDLAREIVKIYDGKKFVSKKFKFIKDHIINNVNGNINKVCTSFLEDISLKKNEDILKKIHINDVSLQLITGTDAEDIVRKEIKDKIINNIYEIDTERKLTIIEQNRIQHLENKRDGLIQITLERLKDELYNNKNLFI